MLNETQPKKFRDSFNTFESFGPNIDKFWSFGLDN